MPKDALVRFRNRVDFKSKFHRDSLGKDKFRPKSAETRAKSPRGRVSK